jgi:hypothetical protein
MKEATALLDRLGHEVVARPAGHSPKSEDPLSRTALRSAQQKCPGTAAEMVDDSYGEPGMGYT